MAFVFSAVVAFLAVCFQASYANHIHLPTHHAAAIRNAAVADAVADAAVQAAALNTYQSPWMPSNSWYTPDLLEFPPFYMPCDCDLSALIDPMVNAEIESIAAQYDQRLCNVQQWERIINDEMPGLDYGSKTRMLTQLASAVKREQIRRGLLYYPDYPEFCWNYSLYGSSTPATTLYPELVQPVGVPQPVLVKRDPMTTVAEALAAEAAEAAADTAASTFTSRYAGLPSYYSLQFMFERFLPRCSPELQMDIQNAIYNNTPYNYYGEAFPTTQKLKSNIRALENDMIEVNNGYPNQLISARPTLVY